MERTPSARSHTLSEVLGTGIVVKFENLQFTAAFKERGALNKLLTLTEDERRCGVVAMSAGNHAQAVARHATRLGIEATIVMPAHTPFVKVQRTEVLGARVVLHGAGLAEATAEAERLAAEGRTFVHPYDDPAVIAGQGTVALELLEDHPELDALVVPTGGGGLLAGMAVVARALRPDITIVGAQSDRWASMLAATTGTDRRDRRPDDRRGHRGARWPARSPQADRARAGRRDRHGARHLGGGGDEPPARDREGRGRGRGRRRHRGAARAPRPAARPPGRRGAQRRQRRPSPAGVGDHARAWSARVASPACTSRSPTSPARSASSPPPSGQAGGNIVEIEHQRMFLDVSARSAELEVVVETIDHDHVERVIAALADVGLVAAVGSVDFGPPLT